MNIESVASSAFDEGLDRLLNTGPEYDSTLTNHGPMVVEALHRLGRDDSIEKWVTTYLRQLDGTPAARKRITSINWPSALGDITRVMDWDLFFQREIATIGWRDTFAVWWERLLPGVAAGATHGIIRTSHAGRALLAQPTEGKLRELAGALSYWAARYQSIPGTQLTNGTLTLQEAISRIPLAPGEVQPGLIRDRLAGLPGISGFATAVSSLRSPESDVGESLSSLVGEFARVFLQKGRRFPTAFVHTITAPAAARTVLPLLSDALQGKTYSALWQLNAAVYSVHARGAAQERISTGRIRDLDSLVDEAISKGDEHCIKITEACRSEFLVTGDEVLLRAAMHGLTLLPED